MPTPVKALVVVALAALVTAGSASARRHGASLTISGGSATIQAGQMSQAFTVTLGGAYGPATVSLSSTSSTGMFSSDSAGNNTTYSVNIPTGGRTATFYYTDTIAGAPTLTAVASGSNFRGNPSASTQVTVTAAPLDQISLSPTSSTIDTSGQQQYIVTGQDLYGNSTGDVTGATSFTIDSGSCSGNTCSASSVGTYTVTANYTGLTATASLTVTAPSAATCQESGPAGGTYTLTLCLSPGGGSTVTGDQSVEATVALNGAISGTSKVLFTLDGQYLLTDFQYSSYTRDTGANTATYVYDFTLPSANWVDGSHTLDASAIQRDGFISTPTAVALTFSNGVSSVPPPPTGFTATPGTNPAPGSPFVLAAVGDGAGGETGETGVTNMIASWNPNLFLYLGDVYEKGTSTEFFNSYGVSGGAFFGQFDPITDPTVGNHEYTAGQAPGYFAYWHTPPDYYSFDTHGWHLVSLNSNLDGSKGSAQYNWLQSDLSNNTQACTLVYFHHPLFNIGIEPVPSRFTDIWPLLAQDGVDIVLTGHDHDYQRWVAMDGKGKPDPAGPTEFVVGTGGHSLQYFASTDPRVANSDSGSFGAMQLDLNPGGASYQYMRTAGGTIDSGTIACNPNGTDLTPPSTPTNLNATTVAQTQISPGSVDLTWNASTDNVAVASYKIFRDGNLVGTVGPQTSFSDDTVSPDTTYSYTVQALDASGNASGQSNPPLSVTTPSTAALFSDGFESGDLSNWDTVSGLTVVPAPTTAYDGAYVAESIGDGSSAVSYAWRTLPSPQTNIYYQLHFKVVSLSSNVYLGWLRTANPAPSGAKAGAILGFYVNSGTGTLGLRNNIPNPSVNIGPGPAVADGNWHTLQVHADIATGRVDTWVDGNLVSTLSATGVDLGTDPVGIIQLGENAKNRTFDVLYDDVAVDTTQIPYTTSTDTTPPSTPTGLGYTTVAQTNALPGSVNLTWSASGDNVAVASYNIFRDGNPVGTVASPQTSFSDDTVAPNTTYSYTVQALDTGGNASGLSSPVSVLTPPASTAVLFSDGFDSGTLSNWDSSPTPTLTVESADTYKISSYAAEAIGTTSAAFAYKTLPAPQSDIYYQLHFKVVSLTGSGTTYLGWLRTGSTGAILGFFVNNKNGHLGLRDQAVPTSITNGPSVNDGAWHTLQVHANILTGQVDTWLDASPVSTLTTTFSTLGLGPVGIIQLGENAKTKTFDVRFDDVTVDAVPIPFS